MSNITVPPEQYALVERVLQRGRELHGAAAVERLSRAFASAAGLASPIAPASAHQKSQFLVPGLTARPFHEAAKFAFSPAIEKAAPLIRRELDSLCAANQFRPYRSDSLMRKGSWDTFYVRVGTTWFEENRQLCPETFRIMASVPRLSEFAVFSALTPGGHIAPHCGAWNCRITFHLGLIIPDRCALRVGPETRGWTPGKLTVFDDTFEHEVWNNANATRYVLLFDVWHPDLTDIEIELLEQLREHAGVHDGTQTVAEIRAERARFLASCRSTDLRHARMPELDHRGISIDWSRLAEPQPDGYDTEVALWLASSTTSAARPQPYQRAPVGTDPALFDGHVAVRTVYHTIPEFATRAAQFPDAPPDHPNLALAAELVRTWPRAFMQCQQLLEAIHPATHPRIPPGSQETYQGAASHSFERLFGTMWATIGCPIGLAEAMVHAMAGQKLRVLGVSFDRARTVVGNSPSERYPSMIVKNRQLPMTGLFHELYSFVYVTALDVAMLEAERQPLRRTTLGQVLAKNLARIKAGYATIAKHLQPGPHGREFLAGFCSWVERTIGAAEALLGPGPAHRNGSGPRAPELSPRPNFRAQHPADLLAAKLPLVFAFNGGIGDRLCNLPALRALAAAFRGRLALVCGQGDREIFYADLDLRAVFEVEFGLVETGFIFDADSLAARIGACDLLLCINPWHTASTSALLARFPNVESIGFFPEFRHPLPCDYEGHAIDMACAVPAFLSRELNLLDHAQPLAISASAAAIAQEFRRRHVGAQRTLFVHTDTKPEKSWLPERFEQVIDCFLDEFPDFCALVVDPRNEGIRRGRFPERTIPVSLPLSACFALLQSSDLFLGIDSCHLHAADLFRVVGVGLFGPTKRRRWGFRFAANRDIQGQVTMESIAVAEVCQALSELALVGEEMRSAEAARGGNRAIIAAAGHDNGGYLHSPPLTKGGNSTL